LAAKVATSGQSIEASRGIQRCVATQAAIMARVEKLHPPRTVVLVGLMGAGKTNIGRRLAQRLGVPFVDADDEIEKAAGCSIADIFAVYGEAVFRDGERRVLARLLDAPPHVLATGGGAFMDASVRAKVREKGVSVWLRADLDTLVYRVSRKSEERPLLAGKDAREVLARLMEQRYPVYAEADITIDSGRESPDATVIQVVAALKQRFAALEAAS
jgi:shikimate kinase